MDTPTFVYLLRNGNMEAAARELGRNFAAREVGNLRDLQRQIATVARGVSAPPDGAPAAADEFARGFLEALAMVASGFEGERMQHERAEADVATARSRANWGTVLEAIHDRDCPTPGTIAADTGLDPSTVSRTLGAMGSAGLLIRVAPDDVQDRRTRPFVLTPRGEDLCRRLFADTSGPIDEIIAAVVDITAALFAVGMVSRAKIREAFAALGPERAERATASLIRELSGTCLAVVNDDESVIAPTVKLHRELEREVQVALARADGGRIVSQLRELAAGQTLYFRTSSRFTEWRVLVNRHQLDRVHVVRDDEPLPEPSDGLAYRLLYESADLVARDHERHGEWLQDFLARATAGGVFDVGAAPLPQDIQLTRHRPGGASCMN